MNTATIKAEDKAAQDEAAVVLLSKMHTASAEAYKAGLTVNRIVKVLYSMLIAFARVNKVSDEELIKDFTESVHYTSKGT